MTENSSSSPNVKLVNPTANERTLLGIFLSLEAVCNANAEAVQSVIQALGKQNAEIRQTLKSHAAALEIVQENNKRVLDALAQLADRIQASSAVPAAPSRPTSSTTTTTPIASSSERTLASYAK